MECCKFVIVGFFKVRKNNKKNLKIDVKKSRWYFTFLVDFKVCKII